MVECIVRYVVVPDRRQYFSDRRIEPAMILVPVFQVWRLTGVERMTVLQREGAERVLAILRHRSLFRVLLAAAGLLFLGAWLVTAVREPRRGLEHPQLQRRSLCGGPW